jgi:hypothetical protein
MSRPPRYRYRQKLDDGAIIEVVIWDVPTPVAGSAHHFKYRCYYGCKDSVNRVLPGFV